MAEVPNFQDERDENEFELTKAEFQNGLDKIMHDFNNQLEKLSMTMELLDFSREESIKFLKYYAVVMAGVIVNLELRNEYVVPLNVLALTLVAFLQLRHSFHRLELTEFVKTIHDDEQTKNIEDLGVYRRFIRNRSKERGVL